MNYDLTYLSLGAGVQSSALLVCSQLGLFNVPRADVAIFADTGDEPQYIYEYLDTLEAWSNIPIHRVKQRGLSLSESTTTTDPSVTRCFMPVYTDNGPLEREGMLMRKCTNQFKIRPIEREVRRLLGYQKGERVKKQARSMIGISFDEIQRMKPSRTKWVENTFPLIDAEINRGKCVSIIADHAPELPRPQKSACVFCPYKSDRDWRKMKNEHPDEFAKAVAFDIAVRDSSTKGEERKVYVHKSCKPLGEVDFDDKQTEFGWVEECEGMCGV